MARRELFLALGFIVAASPAPLAAQPDTQPIVLAATGAAPTAPAAARYWMKVDAITGRQIENVQCWTRDQWADQGVDVDKEWAKNGVKVVPPAMA